VVTSDLFIVNVALPVIGRSYPGSSLSGLSWVLNAYAIIFAALLVPAGRLADHFGRRRFLLAGVAVFTLASAACAAAPTLGVLVAARAVQAAGAALIVPTSLGLLYPAFAKRQHAKVVGIWAGVAAVAGTAGPPVGGLLVEASWRAGRARADQQPDSVAGAFLDRPSRPVSIASRSSRARATRERIVPTGHSHTAAASA
jgi:MFS family permease